MYIKQVFNYQYNFWVYIGGLVLVIIALTLGQLPWAIALIMENGTEILGGSINEMMAGLESNLSLFLILIQYAIALGALFLVVKFIHKQPILKLTTAREKVDWSRIFFAFGVTCILILAGILLDYFLSPEHYVWNFKPVKFLILFLIAVPLLPLQIAFEEYLFRGYLMQGIGVLAKNKWVPLLVTSLIFGGLHYANPEIDALGYFIMVNYIGTGLLLGIITLMDDGLELSLGFHAANNLLIALLVTSDYTAFQTNSLLRDVSVPEKAGWEVFLEVGIIFLFILVIFSKKYKWKNWKERLLGKVERPSNNKLSEES